jgi:membrane peptidoglycan carboxypeptidase
VPVTPVPPLPARPTKPTPTRASPVAPKEKKQLTKAQRRNRIIAYIAATVMLLGLGLMVGTYYVDSVPTPAQLPLPESTTVYYADGKTPMAKLGTENRTILAFDEMNDVVKQAIVAAEDQTFWTNEGVDFLAVMRAAWNNVTGGKTQGASTITQQYARIAADLTGVTFSRKLREAVIAWKLDDRYSKEEILEFYLNTVPFGRGAHGIEAASQSFFGKTANKNAPRRDQVTVAEAMVLVSLVKQPEPDPNDPEGHPGYDPTRSDLARQNSIARWNYVRDAMVGLGYLTRSEADAIEYPKVTAFEPSSRQSGLDLPTGLVVQHALAELRQAEPFRDRGRDYIQNGGFRIVTTVDKRAQEAAEAAADIRRDTAPSVVRGQPQNWQAALVAVEPGTGRVLAYYGGSNGAGADYAGWYVDEDGEARGFGQHSPGSSYKVYDLAEAIRQGESVRTEWDSPNTKEFPASGRTRTSAAGPVRNAGTAPCQPRCELWEATVASLNVTFFALTEKLGRASVIDMARKAGVDFMWANVEGQANPQRVELAGKSAEELEKTFSTEVGIGQFGITVLDHANGMATFAADGKRARAHFVREVFEGDDRVYAEQGHRRQSGQRLGRRRQDGHLAGGHEHDPQRAHLDGGVHEEAGRRRVARYDRRRGARDEERFVQRVRLVVPGPYLAAVHGRGDEGNGAQSGGDRVREPEVRRRNPDTGPIADAGAGTIAGAHLHTRELPRAGALADPTPTPTTTPATTTSVTHRAPDNTAAKPRPRCRRRLD